MVEVRKIPLLRMNHHTLSFKNKSKTTKKKKTSCNIISYLQDSNIEKVDKVTKLAELMQSIYPGIEGDKVTFIGSTFMSFQDSEPYLNHCIVLDECAEPQSENTVYVSCKTEKEVTYGMARFDFRRRP